MAKRMILFDLDGTLWDSSKEVADSWNEIINEKKKAWKDAAVDYQRFSEQLPDKITAADVKGVMGKTMKEIAEILMPAGDPQKRADLFKLCETYEVSYIEKSGASLFPEVRETLQELKKKDYELAIVSNCQINYVRSFLISMDMKKYFCDYEEWGRTGLLKGENIKLVLERNGCSFSKTDEESCNAIYVGDTQKDFDAAKEAGIPFVWAKYGFGQVSGADAEIDNIIRLPEIAERFVP